MIALFQEINIIKFAIITDIKLSFHEGMIALTEKPVQVNRALSMHLVY